MHLSFSSSFCSLSTPEEYFFFSCLIFHCLSTPICLSPVWFWAGSVLRGFNNFYYWEQLPIVAENNATRDKLAHNKFASQKIKPVHWMTLKCSVGCGVSQLGVGLSVQVTPFIFYMTVMTDENRTLSISLKVNWQTLCFSSSGHN